VFHVRKDERSLATLPVSLSDQFQKLEFKEFIIDIELVSTYGKRNQKH
jgi:hypothetical protein